LLFYDRLTRKPPLFKSFIVLSVKQFDDIYDEIKSKYTKLEIKRCLMERIGNNPYRELDISNWMLRIGLSWFWYTTGFTSFILLRVYSLIWTRVIFAETYKIKRLIRSCLPTPHKI
jgi:hypothetical protein